MTMPDSSSRDLVLARREGYVAAKLDDVLAFDTAAVTRAAELEAARLFPLPLKKIPNEQTDENGDVWKYSGGMLLLKGRHSDTYTDIWDSDLVCEASRAAIATVLTTPVVEVEDNG